MSDEFLKVATKEINEEIAFLQQVLSECSDDGDVFSLADKFQKHTHKIKGLAPMMGKEDLGNISASLDSILKKIVNDQKVEGIFSTLNQSISFMEKSMADSNCDLSEINDSVSKILDRLS